MHRFALLAALIAATPLLADDFDGPRQGKGLSNRTLGEIPLAEATAEHTNSTLRMRYWEIEPGGIVPVHNHGTRPSIIWVQQGTIVEHRSDRDEPEIYGPGMVSVEVGIQHWWENTGDETVILIAADVYDKN
ncbi:MAG: cupin domain-containing protein [Pseudomonadota bacterium]